MFNSLSKIGALGFSKRKTLSLFLPLLAILFLIGCGGGGSSKTYHDVSFYDSNLDLVATKTVEEGHINPSELLSGSWYKAGENSQVTDHNLVDDTNFYGVSNVVEITDQVGLDSIRYKLDGKYILLNDITLESGKAGFSTTEGWMPISNTSVRFNGVFNGNYHVIDGLWINRPDLDGVGLFGYTNKAKIKNIGVKISKQKIIGLINVGGIVGQLRGFSVIINSYVEGDINGTKNDAGGIAGYLFDGNVSNSYFKGNVYSDRAVGGIAGSSERGVISNSYSMGSVKSQNSHVGGIVGWTDNGMTASNSYSTAVMNGKMSGGGIVGYVARNGFPICTNNAAINPSVISVDNAPHRIAGRVALSSFTISNNFALDTMMVNGTTIQGDDKENGVSKTINELKMKSTYETGLGWAFGDDETHPWKIDPNKNNGLPYLYWEKR